MRRSTKNGYAWDSKHHDWTHRVRMRTILGGEIPKGYHVHHVDRDPWNPGAKVAAMPAWVHRKHHAWDRDGYRYKVCWRCGGIGHWAQNCWR